MYLFGSLSKHRGALFVSCAANMGAILMGFEAAGIGAILALRRYVLTLAPGVIQWPACFNTGGCSFKLDFNLATNSAAYADAAGTVVTLLNAGALTGCVAPSVLGQRLGRRPIISIAGGFVLLGGILQTAANAPSLAMVYAGRTIAGFGVGMITNTVPVFVAECAPKHLRGAMISAFDLFLIIGGLIGFFVTYGCAIHLPATDVQWRVAMCIQIPLALLVVASPWVLAESPRYFAKKGNWVGAVSSLCKLRSALADDNEIVEEIAEIRAQIDQEIAATQGRSIKELFTKGNWQRLLWGISIPLVRSHPSYSQIICLMPARLLFGVGIMLSFIVRLSRLQFITQAYLS